MSTFNKLVCNVLYIITDGSELAKTQVKYTQASGITPREQTFDIVGELTYIPNISNVKEVDIGSKVTIIGYAAFNGCSGLTNVTIGNNVTIIGYAAFNGCSGLTNVTIGNNVTSIGDSVFYGCIGLTNVTIGNNVMSIEDSVFYGCIGLTSVTIPNSVTSIGEGAFSGCNNLVEVHTPGFTTTEVLANSGTWGLGIDSSDNPFMVIVYCSDGVIVLNDNDGSSSNGSSSNEDTKTRTAFSDGTTSEHVTITVQTSISEGTSHRTS